MEMGDGKEGNSKRILIVDDDQDVLNLLETWISAEGLLVKSAGSGEEALSQLAPFDPVLVITDLFMGGMDGFQLLHKIHQDKPLLPVIMLSGQAQISDAIKATHLGTSAFLVKPVQRQELLDTIKRVLWLYPDPLVFRKKFCKSIIYKSQAMQEVVDLAQLVSGTDVSVFISGETGTGKEEVARVIHTASARRDKAFIAINCGAIPEQLLESELFGHEKGAFTGASIRHEGLFQAANGGTLFLDEIGDMPLVLQVKLLRVLQEFKVRPVGSVHSYPIDVRIVSATHRDLDAAIKDESFRKDLYYRLKVIPITIPPLTERKEDIPLLAKYFLNYFTDRNKQVKKYFSPDTMEYLMTLPWPGNIRQLINVMECCSTLCKTEMIPLNLVTKIVQDRPMPIQTLKEAKLRCEYSYLISALKITHGHVGNAAKIAGRNRTEFYKLLNQHSIKPDHFRRRNMVQQDTVDMKT